MEQNKAERLKENVTEKMCSSCGNGAGEMCSPADTGTHRNRYASHPETLILRAFAGVYEENEVVF